MLFLTLFQIYFLTLCFLCLFFFFFIQRVLHKLEDPKLSILKGMSKAEEGQRRVLFAIDILSKTAKEYQSQINNMEEAKEQALENEVKRKAQEQADAEAKANRENPDDA